MLTILNDCAKGGGPIPTLFPDNVNQCLISLFECAHTHTAHNTHMYTCRSTCRLGDGKVISGNWSL